MNANLNLAKSPMLSGRFRWEKWKMKKVGDKWEPVRLLSQSGWLSNMLTNLAMRGWAARALCENFVIGVVGSGVTLDDRYPSWTNTPGTNISQRTGNAVSITGTTDTTLFAAGDFLVYDDESNGTYFISSRVVNGGNIDLVLKNQDGSEPIGTTASAAPFWIYRASQTAMQDEYKRSGTASKIGSTPAADSDPDSNGGRGFISGDFSGPVTTGQGAVAHAQIASGALTATPVDNGGINYVPNAPPVVLYKGGGAGQFIPGTVTDVSSDSGIIDDTGSTYSQTPGQVTLEVLGPGRNATFTVNVDGSGHLESIVIGAGGEDHFADVYSSANGNLVIKDASGTGKGGKVTLTPRRAPKAKAFIKNGAVDKIVASYAGYRLTTAPTVKFFSTSYLIHERTWAMTVEEGNATVGEVGASASREPGNNLSSRLPLRNLITGESDPVELIEGEQFRLVHQLIENIAPSAETEVLSALMGGFGRQDGTQRFELLGRSVVMVDGSTGWLDPALHANELYFYKPSQMPDCTYAIVVDPSIQDSLRAYISESTAAFGLLGTAVDRATGLNWSTKPIGAPELKHMEGNPDFFPVRVRKRANWSTTSGNNVTAIGSMGLGFLAIAGIPQPPLVRVALTHLFSAAARAQASGNGGKPEKLDTHTLEMIVDYFPGRRFLG